MALLKRAEMVSVVVIVPSKSSMNMVCDRGEVDMLSCRWDGGKVKSLEW